ncbi:MAG: hypothetical protein LCH85_03145 [Chloroflexi bacterium]|nr:hypothetical protein [Chloroflexota bacterium]
MTMYSRQIDAQTRTAQFSYDPRGILWIISLPAAQESPADATENVAVMQRFLANRPNSAVILDMRALEAIDREARHIYTSGDGKFPARALAIVVESATSRITGNLYMTISRGSGRPTRMFQTPADAEIWAVNQLN